MGSKCRRDEIGVVVYHNGGSATLDAGPLGLAAGSEQRRRVASSKGEDQMLDLCWF
jgi:hypothetical protein